MNGSSSSCCYHYSSDTNDNSKYRCCLRLIGLISKRVTNWWPAMLVHCQPSNADRPSASVRSTRWHRAEPFTWPLSSSYRWPSARTWADVKARPGQPDWLNDSFIKSSRTSSRSTAKWVMSMATWWSPEPGAISDTVWPKDYCPGADVATKTTKPKAAATTTTKINTKRRRKNGSLGYDFVILRVRYCCLVTHVTQLPFFKINTIRTKIWN